MSLRTSMVFAVPVWVSVALSLSLSLSPSSPLWALRQDEGEVEAPEATPDRSTPSLERLRLELEELERELASEEAELEQAGAEWAREIADLEEERRELATDLLAAELASRKLTAKNERLERRVPVVEAELAAVTEELATVFARAHDVGEQLVLHLRDVPGGDEISGRAQSALPAMRRGGELDEVDGDEATGSDGTDDTDDTDGTVELEERFDALGELAAIATRVHGEGMSVGLRAATLRTATGRREKVSLLHAGAIAYAYETVGDRRLGLALKSPRQVEGYRWSEDLDRSTETTLRRAFEGLRSPGPAGPAVRVPVDVSGRLSVESVAPKRGVVDLFESGGPVMVPLALVAFLALLLILERSWALGRAGSAGSRWVGQVLRAAREGRYEEAQRFCAGTRGVVARTLAACLEARESGAHAMEDRIQEQLLHELPRLQRFLGGIAVLGAVAPLLGLLGTVTGIIETFGVIRTFGNSNPTFFAGGVSEALITTAVGLVIAIPIVLAHSLLAGRVDRIVAHAERHAATLLNSLTLAQRESAEPAQSEATEPSGSSGSGSRPSSSREGTAANADERRRQT